jgi:hypothetical protein
MDSRLDSLFSGFPTGSSISSYLTIDVKLALQETIDTDLNKFDWSPIPKLEFMIGKSNVQYSGYRKMTDKDFQKPDILSRMKEEFDRISGWWLLEDHIITKYSSLCVAGSSGGGWMITTNNMRIIGGEYDTSSNSNKIQSHFQARSGTYHSLSPFRLELLGAIKLQHYISNIENYPCLYIRI